MNCEGCGAPVSGAKCSYCDRRIAPPPPPPAKRLVCTHGGMHGTLEDVRLEGNGNVIRMAKRCEIIGNGNVIRVAEDCMVQGNGNVIKEERP